MKKKLHSTKSIPPLDRPSPISDPCLTYLFGTPSGKTQAAYARMHQSRDPSPNHKKNRWVVGCYLRIHGARESLVS